ncbi:Kinesin, motor domain-containing protein [Cynara cardunculus var. scolymus]|uniref:Kinesin, motor domain-containing protein n=1 Tax=Cynara cardunculus var. scolymus TaxID=59895 RepID=A0A103Y0S8_CYNCS|nr:Kinesin, motor domain-containing protein [Cynara cardunculus var. scolymus]
MKHFMQPRSAILRDNSSDNPAPNPSSMKQNRSSKRKQKSCKENAPPSDMNVFPDASPSFGKPSPSVASKLKSLLPPRPPSSNPLKRKLGSDFHHENGVSGSSDTGVKVIVRMRPPNKNEEGEMIVQKTSGDSLSILGQQFTFDSVADATSTQASIDLFQLVGAPLVENCLAGFNSSIFAYGQTGSGKTYTIWGPTNTLLEGNSSSNEQGLTPRVFERLFSRITEIYNEQITDLLNPSQRNLHLREDAKTGVYVENLAEEFIYNMKDVMQLLKKGLSNRKTGATSINTESSRSHSVFTCVVESRCKSMDGLSCCKTSRMNLVDLAGSERQKLTGAAGERLKEAGNINRSLSQLGNLINILAEVSQTGKQRHIPYRDSKLTFLLQESLGGNAKLVMVCAISPSQSCRSETFSTLRFAQRAKAIKNKAIVNEQMQNDVNTLREVIRQLKDELVRMKSTGNQDDPSAGYSTGWNARRSLNLLKFSLSRPMMLPHVDDDGDEEMEIVEEGEQVLLSGSEVNKKMGIGASGILTRDCIPNVSGIANINRKDSEDTDVNMEEVGNLEVTVVHSIEANGDTDSLGKPHDSLYLSTSELLEKETRLPISTAESGNHVLTDAVKDDASAQNGSGDCVIPNVTLEPSEVSPVLKSPIPSVSPITDNSSSRKSLRTSSMLTASQKELTQTTVSSNFENPCMKPSKSISSNPLSSNIRRSCLPSDHLAASLHRGLEVIDKHCKSSAFGRSSFRFTCKPLDSKPVLVQKDDGVQTLLQGNELDEEKPMMFLCRNCNCISSPKVKDGSDGPNLQLLPVDGQQLVPTDSSQLADKSKQLVPKAVEKVLTGAIRREMALEELYTRQDSEINQLNRLLHQYKHERECNLIIGQIREDKIARLESLMDGILSAEEFRDDELASLKNENKILKENYENHPEVLRTEIEFKRVQDELERYQNFFDLGERDVLLEEIQDLRTQLQSYMDSSAKKRNPVLQITYPSDPSVVPPLNTVQESAEHRFESERIRWKEAESKWISLAEDLRCELEASRLLVEKQKHELDTEKKCSKELKEAMQMAMEGHARMLEQYADLDEKHMHLLTMQRRIQDGITDVKKAAARAGVRGTESKFINALAEEISILKAEREKERCHYRDENKGLQAQLRDTAEAVQAAGELLVRLKEAEEAVAAAEIVNLKRKHENGVLPLVSDGGEPNGTSDQQWRDEFDTFYSEDEGELSKLPEPSSWFSGYDRCNI